MQRVRPVRRLFQLIRLIMSRIGHNFHGSTCPPPPHNQLQPMLESRDQLHQPVSPQPKCKHANGSIGSIRLRRLVTQDVGSGESTRADTQGHGPYALCVFVKVTKQCGTILECRPKRRDSSFK